MKQMKMRVLKSFVCLPHAREHVALIRGTSACEHKEKTRANCAVENEAEQAETQLSGGGLSFDFSRIGNSQMPICCELMSLGLKIVH